MGLVFGLKALFNNHMVSEGNYVVQKYWTKYLPTAESIQLCVDCEDKQAEAAV